MSKSARPSLPDYPEFAALRDRFPSLSVRQKHYLLQLADRLRRCHENRVRLKDLAHKERQAFRQVLKDWGREGEAEPPGGWWVPGHDYYGAITLLHQFAASLTPPVAIFGPGDDPLAVIRSLPAQTTGTRDLLDAINQAGAEYDRRRECARRGVEAKAAELRRAASTPGGRDAREFAHGLARAILDWALSLPGWTVAQRLANQWVAACSEDDAEGKLLRECLRYAARCSEGRARGEEPDAAALGQALAEVLPQLQAARLPDLIGQAIEAGNELAGFGPTQHADASTAKQLQKEALQEAMERRREENAATRAPKPDDADLMAEVRKAVQRCGKDAKSANVIKEAGVNEQKARKALRELERLGEYCGFQKRKAARHR